MQEIIVSSDTRLSAYRGFSKGSYREVTSLATGSSGMLSLQLLLRLERRSATLMPPARRRKIDCSMNKSIRFSMKKPLRDLPTEFLTEFRKK